MADSIDKELDGYFDLGLDPWIGAGNFFEEIIEEIYSAILNPGDIAIDCGANCGLHTLPLCKLVGGRGLVVAVEPLPDMANALGHQISQQYLTNAVIVNKAVGERIGDTQFTHVAGNNAYSGRMQRLDLPPETLPSVEQINVPMITLDQLRDDLQLSEVRFIKLDLEGGEYHALRGCRKVMDSDSPLIIFENGRQAAADLYGYTKQDWFEFFQVSGYEIYDLFGRKFDENLWVKDRVPWSIIAAKRNSDIAFVNFAISSITKKTFARVNNRRELASQRQSA